MARICSDLVVVELGSGSAAASEAGMFLADNGARVIKVEPPAGDRFRSSLPSAWLVWNRGKESLAADLSTVEGQTLVRQAVASADVVIEALPPGAAERYGLGYETLAAADPSLVYCSITAFGPVGPYAGIPADDALVMAKAGAFSRGPFGFRPGPIFSGARVPSNGCAHMATAGILAALMVRDRTGAGQRVDASLYQGMTPIDYFSFYHVQLAARAAANPAPPSGPAPGRPMPVANRYMVSACTRDGRWLFFSPQLPHQARALLDVLELGHLAEDERFRDMPAFMTLEDADAWEYAIYERVKERDLDEWIKRALENDDLPFEPVLSAEEALEHPQLVANGAVVTVEDPKLGPIQQIGPVAAFSATPCIIERSAPELGAHEPLPPAKQATRPRGTPPGGHPLEGVTIVEFGYFYAMPYGVTMAAALGARVIKVESNEGDPMRWSFGAPEWGALKTTEGKESICFDARSAEGRRIMRELLSRADVFVQGFRPGVDRRLGIDYETVHELNPRLVYVHGAGYGSSGPYAHRPIYAGTAASGAGSVHRQAAHWLDPELNRSLDALASQAVVAPRMRNLTDGDANAAVGVFSAILLGLRHRERTGEGQFVGTSMLGGNAMAYSDDFNRYPSKVPVPQADPEQYGLSATYRLYPAQAGWVFFAAAAQEEWEAAVDVLGDDQLGTDVRFSDPESRAANDAALVERLEALFSRHPADEWESRLLAVGVGCVAVSERSHAEAMSTDPNLRTMGMVAEVEHPVFGPLLRYAAPVALSATPGRVAPGCTVGQHTASILAELGYSSTDIDGLAARGLVRLGGGGQS